MRLSNLFCGLLLASSAPTMAADAAHGKQLVDGNCHSCHGTEVYTRPDRKVVSREGLHKQVRRCELALGLKWFDEDIADASAYLNATYYKFK